MTSATTRVVVWFRNDLRLADNYVIKRAEALAVADPNVEVLPVYCFDPRFFERSAWGSPKTGGHRARFQFQCVADLQKNLRLIGSDLLVVVGKPEEVIAPLVLGDGKTTVVLTQASRRPKTNVVLFIRFLRFFRRAESAKSSSPPRLLSRLRVVADEEIHLNLRSGGRIRRRDESKLYSLCYLRHSKAKDEAERVRVDVREAVARHAHAGAPYSPSPLLFFFDSTPETKPKKTGGDLERGARG